MSWTHGYHADSGYTYGYYPETMPMRLHWAALIQGKITPTKKFRYLDAGCGQGLNLILAAASHPDSEFIGLDFMPNHIAHARELAKNCGLKNVQFFEADFSQLVQDPEAIASLNSFDYAICHGISTWVAPHIKQALYTLIGLILKPGGVFYNSYNTHPGWLNAVPFQHLVLLEQERVSGNEAFAAARNTMESLAEHGEFLNIFPSFKGRLDSYKKLDAAYLVQEYNNLSWQPVFVSQMLDELAAVKLDYLGPATLGEAYLEDLPAHLRALIDRQPTLKLKLQIQDYGLNQSFRRDLYVKGKVSAWPQYLEEHLQNIRVVTNLLTARPKADEPYVFASGSLRVKGHHAIYSAILEQCAVEGGLSLQDIRIPDQNLAMPAITKMVSLLIQGGWLCFCIDEHQSSEQVNKTIADAVCAGAPYQYLSLPKAGGAFAVNQLDMLIINGYLHQISETDIAGRVVKQLNKLGRNLSKGGENVSDPLIAIQMIQERMNTWKPLFDWLKKMDVL